MSSRSRGNRVARAAELGVVALCALLFVAGMASYWGTFGWASRTFGTQFFVSSTYLWILRFYPDLIPPFMAVGGPGWFWSNVRNASVVYSGGPDGLPLTLRIWLGWPLLAALVPSLWIIYRHLRTAPGVCPDCGYDMAGLRLPTRCPECGAEIAARRKAMNATAPRNGGRM